MAAACVASGQVAWMMPQGPRPEEDGEHAGGVGGDDVVVDAVADVGDGGGGEAADVGDLGEEAGVGLFEAPGGGGGRGGPVARPQAARAASASAGWLPAMPTTRPWGFAGGEAGGGVGVEVARFDGEAAAGGGAGGAGLGHVDAGGDHVEDGAVGGAGGDCGADGGEEVGAADGEPVGPLVEHAGFVDEGAADVEEHGFNRHLQAFGLLWGRDVS